MRCAGSPASSKPFATRLASDQGAATVEWTLVSALLTLLFLAVLQLGFALHVRVTLLDAAAEGARTAGLYGASAIDGHARTEQLIALALADDYANDINVERSATLATVTVRAPLPVIGIWGFPEGIEVTAHAPVEE